MPTHKFARGTAGIAAGERPANNAPNTFESRVKDLDRQWPNNTHQNIAFLYLREYGCPDNPMFDDLDREVADLMLHQQLDMTTTAARVTPNALGGYYEGDELHRIIANTRDNVHDKTTRLVTRVLEELS